MSPKAAAKKPAFTDELHAYIARRQAEGVTSAVATEEFLKLRRKGAARG